MSIDGTECASGKSASLKVTPDEDLSQLTLSRDETMLCDDMSLSSQDYVLLKTALLKEQAAKLHGLPLRSNVGGGGSVDDVLELKSVVKEFMKRSGWLPFFS